MTNRNINIAIVGVGNCASSLIQGIYYYGNYDVDVLPGLMHFDLGGYKISDIKPVAAFDVDKRKIGMYLSDAIYSEPNNTKDFLSLSGYDIEYMDREAKVMKGPVLDGVADHMKQYFQVDDNQKELTKEEIISILKERKADIIINYLPVGSTHATEFWANMALESKCAFVNCIPVFITSNPEWAKKFESAILPIIGDDVKSQVGSTIVNRALVQMIQDRGGKIVNSWQTNFGGNTDFLNMTSQDRLESKKISKTESISSLIHNKDNYVYAGPNGFIECLSDNKISHMRIDFSIFGNIPCYIDLKLSVEDSPNSAGIVVDAIRCAKLALDRGIGGPIYSACGYFCKRPPIKMTDEKARKQLEDFINM